MILLDASALLAHLRAEPAGPEVEELIRGGGTAMSVANLAEVIDKVLRETGIEAADLDSLLSTLVGELVSVRPLDERTARRAGRLRARHYHRRSSPVSLADCILLATAGADDSIATSDGVLLRAAASEQISTVSLPDSSGRRPG